MKTINIVWQRLVDESGRTCDRCGGTEQELHKALRFLTKAFMPMGLAFSLETREMDNQEFSQNPSESNRIWIDGKPLEKWLNAETGVSSCCGPCGDAQCRTVTVEGETYETISADLIVKAALMAVEREVKKLTAKPPGS
ncbi:MAG: DUF2703 domain-containing protein [Deltaproteobacteria bacterium]|nr:DUF2703 domain-containing protein [Deltaproteobacteria bacterium]